MVASYYEAGFKHLNPSPCQRRLRIGTTGRDARARAASERYPLGMLEELTVTVDASKQGVLADIGELLGRQKVNIETLSASTHNGEGVLHLIVDDGEEAAEVLASNGYQVGAARRVLTVTLED